MKKLALISLIVPLVFFLTPVFVNAQACIRVGDHCALPNVVGKCDTNIEGSLYCQQATSKYNFTKDLMKGFRGAEVTELQKFLIAAGFDIPAITRGGVVAYGVFGGQTQTAVVAFQKAHSLVKEDGIVGRCTRAVLNGIAIPAGCAASPPSASPTVGVPVVSSPLSPTSPTTGAIPAKPTVSPPSPSTAGTAQTKPTVIQPTPTAPTSGKGGINLTYLQGYKNSIVDVINKIIVPVLFALAFIVFLYGVFLKYIFSHGDATKVSEGHKLILWGLIGFFVMISLWGIVNVIDATLNFGQAGIAPPRLPTI